MWFFFLLKATADPYRIVTCILFSWSFNNFRDDLTFSIYQRQVAQYISIGVSSQKNNILLNGKTLLVLCKNLACLFVNVYYTSTLSSTVQVSGICFFNATWSDSPFNLFSLTKNLVSCYVRT